MKDFILKMQEEKSKMSKNKKMQGKYDRFRCFFIYQNEKNYDKKSGTGPLWHDLSIGAGDQQYCFVFFSWKPDAAGKCGDDGKDDFRSRIHTRYG